MCKFNFRGNLTLLWYADTRVPFRLKTPVTVQDDRKSTSLCMLIFLNPERDGFDRLSAQGRWRSPLAGGAGVPGLSDLARPVDNALPLPPSVPRASCFSGCLVSWGAH